MCSWCLAGKHRACSGPCDCLCSGQFKTRAHGFTLIELSIVLAVTLILMVASAPRLVTVANNATQAAAKRRVMLIWQMEGSYQTCLTLTPTQCSGLLAMLPVSGVPVTAGSYTYLYTVTGSTWNYVATPYGPNLYLSTITMTSAGAMTYD